MTTLLLVRHGESLANRYYLFAGHYDPELHENGIIQARLTAKYIKDNYCVDKVYASDLKRAYNTGKVIADLVGVNIIKSENLREIYAGEWEGLPFNEIVIRYPKEVHIWMNNIGSSCCPNGESVKEMSDRFYSELKKIACENYGKTIVVATHSTPIRAMQSVVQTGTLDKMSDILWVSNASITTLEYDNGIWNFKEIGYDAHLGATKTEIPINI